MEKSKKGFLVLLPEGKRGCTFDFEGQKDGIVNVYEEKQPYTFVFAQTSKKYDLKNIFIAGQL